MTKILPFARRSDTSKEAAESMVEAASGYEADVLDYIRLRGALGATADECLVWLNLSHQNGSARVSELAKKGLIIKSGRRRKTRSGRNAEVYVAAVFAREVP